MRVFISYCDNDGLALASVAAHILEAHKHETWYFDRDKSVGMARGEDIANHIRYWCDQVLFLCTHGSMSSSGQRKELAQWDSVDKQIIGIQIDSATVPDVIEPYIYEPMSNNGFKAEFDEFVQNKWDGITEEWRQYHPETKVENQ